LQAYTRAPGANENSKAEPGTHVPPGKFDFDFDTVISQSGITSVEYIADHG
jgi:hypothetical protein